MKNQSTAFSNSPQFFLLVFFASFLSNLVMISASSLGHETGSEREGRTVLGRRVLMGFKETPAGSNVTYDCSPSGPCLACAYSEKNDEKYRCSETGYRIPLKCIEVRAHSEETNSKKTQKNRSTLENIQVEGKSNAALHDKEENTASVRARSLLEHSTTSVGGLQAYVTYRSCIPAANEEKLSVLGFEGIMFGLLLMSSSAVYLRRRRTNSMSGVGAIRLPTNSRF